MAEAGDTDPAILARRLNLTIPACRLYKLPVDEFLAWERDIDRHGLHGLRSTRYQIYRDTENREAVGIKCAGRYNPISRPRPNTGAVRCL
jgi:hypothetical protein